MKLYRIILVDDEEEVRKSIIRKIKWEENADSHFTKDKGKSESGDRTEAKCKPFAGKLYKKPADPPGTVFK